MGLQWRLEVFSYTAKLAPDELKFLTPHREDRARRIRNVECKARRRRQYGIYGEEPDAHRRL